MDYRDKIKFADEKSPEFIKNMDYFFRNSNEDVQITTDFLKEFRKRYKQPKTKLDWLDVGTGPCVKPIMILEGSNRNSGLINDFNEIYIDVIEPEESWHDIFTHNLNELGLYWLITNIFSSTWEDFDQDKKYNLITFFHSTYGIDPESLGKVPNILHEGGIACIILEDPESALYKIKQRVSSYINLRETVSFSKEISDVLSQKGIYHEIQKNESKRMLYVDDLLKDDDITQLSFLLQTKLENHDKRIQKKVLNEMKDELNKHIKEDQNRKKYIETPDEFIWVYN